MKQLLLLVSGAVIALSSCKKNDDGKAGIFKGPEVAFQHGKATTWVQLDAAGKPERLAISINAAAMNSLDPGEPGEGGHDHSNSVSIPFHNKAGETPFKHAMLDWNPHGHEPAGVYDLPHFDFHFYMTTEAERMAIPPYEVDSSKFLNLPAAGYMPEVYVPIPGGVPMMGTHWIDVNAPELHGQGFSQTFLLGSYDGKNTFYEPMITKAFIDAHETFERAFPIPQKFAQSGYYPTRMRLSKAGGGLDIILEGFVYRQAN